MGDNPFSPWGRPDDPAADGDDESDRGPEWEHWLARFAYLYEALAAHGISPVDADEMTVFQAASVVGAHRVAARRQTEGPQPLPPVAQKPTIRASKAAQRVAPPEGRELVWNVPDAFLAAEQARRDRAASNKAKQADERRARNQRGVNRQASEPERSN